MSEDRATELVTRYFGGIEPGGESGIVKPGMMDFRVGLRLS